MRGRQGRERLVAPPSRNLTGVDGAAGSASASGVARNAVGLVVPRPCQALGRAFREIGEGSVRALAGVVQRVDCCVVKSPYGLPEVVPRVRDRRGDDVGRSDAARRSGRLLGAEG